jgi:hypothetical protein
MLGSPALRRFIGVLSRAGSALVLAFGAVLVTACAHVSGSFPSDSTVRPATDLPARFIAESPPATGAAAEQATCRSPLVDPRDGARLVLYRSREGARGDYQAPPGRYGAGAAELLRVDCASGAAIGIVRR